MKIMISVTLETHQYIIRHFSCKHGRKSICPYQPLRAEVVVTVLGQSFLVKKKHWDFEQVYVNILKMDEKCREATEIFVKRSGSMREGLGRPTNALKK